MGRLSRPVRHRADVAQALLLGELASGGVEGALGNGWSAKVEYLYVDLANSNFVITGASNGYRFGLIRAGVNYRF